MSRCPFLALIFLLTAAASAADQRTPPTVRWQEGEPNCTLRAGDDGHIYYGLSSAIFEVTLSVDRQELEKIPHRAVPMLGVFVSFHYKGNGHFEVRPRPFALEFVKHSHVVQNPIDPYDMLKSLQGNIDDLTDEVERHQIRKHPEQKEKKEAELQARLKDYTEMMDFLSPRALRRTMLDPTNSSVSGWVFFSTKNRWIGAWRRPEQFILRLPLDNGTVEFPFELPPKAGKVELRRRPGT